MKLTNGALLWKYAKTIIPGGNQILSKRSERFLPRFWPAYYRRAKGCVVWDMQGRKYFDFAQMGVGSCVLGYSDSTVNKAVQTSIQKGSMCTLNCYEEILLTKELLKLHPWAEMARYSRSGGEACAIAIRIARSATGRDKIAFCGYHGWHDWYLSSNIANKKNLDGQLLPGLEPKGVPRALKSSTIPFKYNSIESLKKIFRRSGKKIAAVIMEPVRNEIPSKTYLLSVKKLCKKYGSILIFDEITSGFRESAGGIHLKYKVCPDICILGKALGNGFPISAIIGTRKIMKSAQDSFISSTFWGERIGFSAALACVKKFQKKKVHIQITKMGSLLMDGWQKLATKHGLKIKISGIPALATITFLDQEPNVVQTLYAKIMLQKGFLVGKAVYSCLAYNQITLKLFLKATDESFAVIAKKIKLRGKSPIYRGPLISQEFKRLN